jgi:hypothetical protein
VTAQNEYFEERWRQLEKSLNEGLDQKMSALETESVSHGRELQEAASALQAQGIDVAKPNVWDLMPEVKPHHFGMPWLVICVVICIFVFAQMFWAFSHPIPQIIIGTFCFMMGLSYLATVSILTKLQSATMKVRAFGFSLPRIAERKFKSIRLFSVIQMSLEIFTVTTLVYTATLVCLVTERYPPVLLIPLKEPRPSTTPAPFSKVEPCTSPAPPSVKALSPVGTVVF